MEKINLINTTLDNIYATQINKNEIRYKHIIESYNINAKEFNLIKTTLLTYYAYRGANYIGKIYGLNGINNIIENVHNNILTVHFDKLELSSEYKIIVDISSLNKINKIIFKNFKNLKINYNNSSLEIKEISFIDTTIINDAEFKENIINNDIIITIYNSY